MAIATRAAECVRLFEAALPTVSSDVLRQEWENQVFRFNLWATNNLVFAPTRASMDWRLRNAPLLDSAMVELLDDLRSSLIKLGAVMKNQVTREGGTSPFDAIGEELEGLFRLSRAIRRSGILRRFVKVASYVEYDESGTNLMDEFRKAVERIVKYRLQHSIASPTVQDRIVNSICLRQQHFAYLRARWEKSGRMRDHSNTNSSLPPQSSFGGTFSVTGSVSSSAGGGSRKKTKPSKLPFPGSSIFTATTAQYERVRKVPSVTSDRSVERDVRLDEDDIPLPPRIPPEVVEYECPFCFLVCPVEDFGGVRWKKHIIQDLMPYVCVLESCPSPHSLFESGKDWIAHMKKQHVVSGWTCMDGGHETTLFFDTDSTFKDHMHQYHSGEFHDEELNELAVACYHRLPLGDLITECPFCPDGHSKDFRGIELINHVAAHLLSLAQISIAGYMDGDGGPSDKAETSLHRPSQDASERSIADRLRAEFPFPDDIEVDPTYAYESTPMDIPDGNGLLCDELWGVVREALQLPPLHSPAPSDLPVPEIRVHEEGKPNSDTADQTGLGLGHGEATSAPAKVHGFTPITPSRDPPAILTLIPINGTFEKKQINPPLYPDSMRIGRQTNSKTVPTPLNGYFDSKVLSRQHAEIWADKSGKIWIRDTKSANGTFINGQRLSSENRDSEPHEIHENDTLELGIDILSEDLRMLIHHKISAKVEQAGIYGPVQNSEVHPTEEMRDSSGSNEPFSEIRKRRESRREEEETRAAEERERQRVRWADMPVEPHRVDVENTGFAAAMGTATALAESGTSLVTDDPDDQPVVTAPSPGVQSREKPPYEDYAEFFRPRELQVFRDNDNLPRISRPTVVETEPAGDEQSRRTRSSLPWPVPEFKITEPPVEPPADDPRLVSTPTVGEPEPGDSPPPESNTMSNAPGPMISMQLYGLIVTQLEYFFSFENLAKDLYLRKHMDTQGFVTLTFIASFNRIKKLTDDYEVLRHVARQLKNVEYFVGEDNVDRLRARDEWERWVLPFDERDPSAQHLGPVLPHSDHSAHLNENNLPWLVPELTVTQPAEEGGAILMRQLAKDTSLEDLRSMFLFSKDFIDADFVPSVHEDHEFRSAIAHFRTMASAGEAQALLDGKPNGKNDVIMIVDICFLPGAPSRVRPDISSTYRR